MKMNFVIVEVSEVCFGNGKSWMLIFRGVKYNCRINDTVYPLKQKSMISLNAFDLCPKGYYS